MNEKNIIGIKIKSLRKSKGITQEELTSKLQLEGLDIDRPMVSRIESRTRTIPDYEAKLIAKVLNVSINELFE